MGKRKKKADWDDYANVEFEAVDFQGGTIADMRQIYQDRWTMVAFSAAILQRDHEGCKDFVAKMNTRDEDGRTLERFLKDLQADQEYFAALIEGMKAAQVRLLAGAVRLAEEESADAG